MKDKEPRQLREGPVQRGGINPPPTRPPARIKPAAMGPKQPPRKSPSPSLSLELQVLVRAGEWKAGDETEA